MCDSVSNVYFGNFQLDIEDKATDKHSGVQEEMKANLKFTHIKHQYDLGNIAKGLSKKINRVTLTKGLK